VTPDPQVVEAMAAALGRAGCVAAAEEAAELAAAAAGDLPRLATLLQRRLAGEPLAWVTGKVRFGDLSVRVDPGVYVPRWQSLELVERAARHLTNAPTPARAIDLCTGSGAIAALLAARHPAARIVATDSDPAAVACARANGVDALLGDLFGPVPSDWLGRTDVVVAVVPYVPAGALRLLPRDTLAFEAVAHYDGGPQGTEFLDRVVADAPRYLHAGGALVLELGGEQADTVGAAMECRGFDCIESWHDDDGDVRGLEGTLTES
jgi:release factor glutamine methyltransferase